MQFYCITYALSLHIGKAGKTVQNNNFKELAVSEFLKKAFSPVKLGKLELRNRIIKAGTYV